MSEAAVDPIEQAVPQITQLAEHYDTPRPMVHLDLTEVGRSLLPFIVTFLDSIVFMCVVPILIANDFSAVV